MVAAHCLYIFAEFKSEMHNIYMRACKDLTKQWRNLPFVSIDNVIFNILETWPPEWHALDITEIEKTAAQRKKEEAKLHIT